MAKQAPVKPLEPTIVEIQSEELVIGSQSQSLRDLVERSLNPDQIAQLKRIAYYTSKVGLSLEESCNLVDIDHEYFKRFMEANPFVRKIIQMKELEYKKDLMFTLSQKARQGDDKLAQWLLERRYPEEFSTKRRSGDGDGDILFQAVSFIQKNGDSNPMVQETSGQAYSVRKTAMGEVIEEKTNWGEKLKELLGGK